MLAVKTSKSPNWDRLISRYKNVKRDNPITKTGVVKWFVAEGQKEAAHQLDVAVYNTPLPPGSQRTRNTRKAISGRMLNEFTGVVFIDRKIANRNGFYYPRVLEFGRRDVNYRGRHYWLATRSIMKARIRTEGKRALHQLKVSIKVT